MKKNKYFTLLLAIIIIWTASLFSVNAAELSLDDGTYPVSLELSGGSGKASVKAESTMVVEDGKGTVTVTWSSPNYDYMIVGDETFYTVNESGNSVFEIPVLAINEGFTVIGDTVAMSKPHEIEYVLTVNVDEGSSSNNLPVFLGVATVFLATFAQMSKKKNEKEKANDGQ